MPHASRAGGARCSDRPGERRTGGEPGIATGDGKPDLPPRPASLHRALPRDSGAAVVPAILGGLAVAYSGPPRVAADVPMADHRPAVLRAGETTREQRTRKAARSSGRQEANRAPTQGVSKPHLPTWETRQR